MSTATLKPARSTMIMENIQEVLDAEDSAAWATLAAQNQYLTPDWLVRECNAKLPNKSPSSVIDPQVGMGALVKCFDGWGTMRFGVDLDNRLDGSGVNLITANCCKVFEVINDLYPGLRFECANANPPFGKRWKKGDTFVDSTLATWEWVIEHGRFGYFIANQKTLEKLGIYKHPLVYASKQYKGSELWQGMREELVIGVVWWRSEHPIVTDQSGLMIAWNQVKKVVEEEATARPKWNIYLDHAGYLRTYLSTRTAVKRKLDRSEILRLHQVNDAHPLVLCAEKETRQLMESLISCGFYTIEPAAEQAIQQALADVNRIAVPIMPTTSFEAVAYADEEEELECIGGIDDGKMRFVQGKRYHIATGTYKFAQKFKRTKVHFNEQTNETYTAEHECTLSGNDRYIRVTDESGSRVRFMDRPVNPDVDFEEARLWEIFKKPVVRTIAETMPDKIELNTAVLKSCEMMAGYKYYDGQLRYLARVACKDYGLIAADVGTGKSLFALSLIAMKGPERTLIIAPQGTMRTSESEEDDDEDGQEYQASQWIAEINKFVPFLEVWELFSEDDYERICSLNGGTLPPGVYVSYPDAMFKNKARETAAATWDDETLNKHMRGIVGHKYKGLPVVPDHETDKRFWCKTVGEEREGIRCIIQPCLATKIGHLFDCVMLDEAHLMCNLGAQVTQMILRLQPRYRYAFTASVIPNIVSNLFSLMGWLAVPNWYKGGLRNAAWPYAREEIGRFNGAFLSEERDHTQEDMNYQKNREWRGKVVKVSPVISAPARLLKILKPSMAFISKEECNPKYQPAKIIDVRVPLGKEQSVLYAHFLNRANIQAKHPLIRARKQTAYLRAVCADPAGFRHGGPKVYSNMNPKTVAALELIRQILSEGEQVVVICARVGQSDTIQARLAEAGVPFARIDSTVKAEQHSHQANLFKSGKARVMLMGIKCAASHSFHLCRYEVILSLEYSYGTLHQARGRVDRVNSRPGVTIYCILHKNSLEELQFDLVATKGDAATICLRGQRVPREFHPIDAGELLARNIMTFDLNASTPEADCERQWPTLCGALREALTNRK